MKKEFQVARELVPKDEVERLLIGVGVPKALIENLPVYEVLTSFTQSRIDSYALDSGLVPREIIGRRHARELGEFLWNEGMCENSVEIDDSPRRPHTEESIVTTRINVIRKKEG